MVQILNHGGVVKKLQGQSVKGKTVINGAVIYSAPYAKYVHENLNAQHPTGQAKFLEEPARMYQKEMTEIIERNAKRRHLREGVEKALQFLLDRSRPLVPMKTGYLRNSGEVIIH